MSLLVIYFIYGSVYMSTKKEHIFHIYIHYIIRTIECIK